LRPRPATSSNLLYVGALERSTTLERRPSSLTEARRGI
jgi:hypothetical protein